jgi:O-antigen ligase
MIFSLGFPAIGVHEAGEDGQNHAGAWKGLYGHKNAFGSMMVLTLITFFTLPKENSRIYRWFGFSLALILMRLSTSATSLVLSLLLILIIVFYKRFRWRGKISVIFLDMGILIGGCVAFILFTYWVELVTGLGRDPTITGRTPMWGVAIARLMERPLLGFGRGAFWAPKSPYAIEASRAIGSGGWIPPHAHNGLIDLALDVGLIGTLIFLFCYFTTFAQALKRAYVTKNPENLWPLAYLVFLTMNNVTESLLLYLTNIYWVLFITVVFTINDTKKFKKITV